MQPSVNRLPFAPLPFTPSPILPLSVPARIAQSASTEIMVKNQVHPIEQNAMARWPKHVWTSIFTYGTIFLVFPLLCLLAYAWVRGWIY